MLQVQPARTLRSGLQKPRRPESGKRERGPLGRRNSGPRTIRLQPPEKREPPPDARLGTLCKAHEQQGWHETWKRYSNPNRSGRRSTDWRTKDGLIICYNCGVAGNSAANCWRVDKSRGIPILKPQQESTRVTEPHITGTINGSARSNGQG